MLEQVISGQVKKLLAKLAKEKVFDQAYLAGGTALALRLGHRLSFDLDFYTPRRFKERELVLRLKKVDNFSETQVDEQTVLGYFPEIKFSFFHYPYKILNDGEEINGITVASMQDIAAMKIGAISGRGTKRDFIDLYFISQKGLTISEMLRLYDRKYGNLSEIGPHILKSLTYFDDAQKDEMPKMLIDCQWRKVKQYFLAQTPKALDEFLEAFS